MDPVTWAAIGATATALTAIGTGVSAYGQNETAKAQAAADQQRADIEGQWAERRADEQRTAGQHAAIQEQRKAEFAQSRLTALAGAGGGSASDPGVMELWGDIAKEGDYNAAMAQGGAEQKATGTEYQAGLDAWTTDANGRIKRQGGNTALIAGLLSAGGQMGSGMAKRYGGGPSPTTGTGYGNWTTTTRRA